jgi:hypothetical protein
MLQDLRHTLPLSISSLFNEAQTKQLGMTGLTKNVPKRTQKEAVVPQFKATSENLPGETE